jgi:hypothetical protein
VGHGRGAHVAHASDWMLDLGQDTENPHHAAPQSACGGGAWSGWITAASHRTVSFVAQVCGELGVLHMNASKTMIFAAILIRVKSKHEV